MLLRRTSLAVAALALGAVTLTAHALAAGPPTQGQVVTRTLWSPALARHERVVVYLPPGYARTGAEYPLVVFLHGVPGRPEDFVDHGAVGRIDALTSGGQIAPFVAAFPQGSDRPSDDNEWADSARRPGERWETYVATDVVRFLRSHYRVRRDAGGMGIAGMSMGGFGAMNIALHHRREFGVVESWSGYFTANTPSVHLPSSPAGRAYSPQVYAGTLTPSLQSWHPAIDFYVGSRDRFAAENVAFDGRLTALGVPHRFREVAGAGHNWSLWNSQLDREIAFLESGFARTSGGAAVG